MKWRQRIVRKERKARKLTSDITVFSKTRHCRGLTSLLLVMSEPTPWLALQINFTCGRTTSFLHSLTLPTKVHFCHICVWQSRELLFQGVWRIVSPTGLLRFRLGTQDECCVYFQKIITIHIVLKSFIPLFYLLLWVSRWSSKCLSTFEHARSNTYCLRRWIEAELSVGH